METKQYVHVFADFTPSGEIWPREILWKDGRRYIIDRVLEVRRAASLKQGGSGWRYTCIICGQPRYLFLEEGRRWFV